ncbi:MAG TPA: sigma-70 family RNA polymerase sigma factor [Blastocatellia bacterium]|nr:sigma-70 family RNA polymerase sigma factor [Blastocatellia bacterium]
MRTTDSDVTRLLDQLRAGDRTALDELMPLVYAELRRMAAGYLRGERAGHTLQPTALVHEAYLKLADQSGLQPESRAHFLGIAARMMRQALVDHARRHRASKRAGALVRVTYDEDLPVPQEFDVEVIELNDALDALAATDERLARVVELRYFGGLTISETAEVLDVGTATVEREWRLARAWLHRAISGAEAE